jgi:hypothetical protein
MVGYVDNKRAIGVCLEELACSSAIYGVRSCVPGLDPVDVVAGSVEPACVIALSRFDRGWCHIFLHCVAFAPC